LSAAIERAPGESTKEVATIGEAEHGATGRMFDSEDQKEGMRVSR
jgi:hypothetical protein